MTRTAAELSEIDWSAAPPELQALAASLEKVASDAATFGCHELVRERVAAWMGGL